MPEKGTSEYDELESNPDKTLLRTITAQLQTVLGISLIEMICLGILVMKCILSRETLLIRKLVMKCIMSGHLTPKCWRPLRGLGRSWLKLRMEYNNCEYEKLMMRN